MLTATVSEAFAAMSRENRDPEIARSFALTTYRVRVSLGGRERSYRAAFVWHTAADGSRVTFRVFDHMTQGVARALAEAVPPEGTVEEHQPENSRVNEAPGTPRVRNPEENRSARPYSIAQSPYSPITAAIGGQCRSSSFIDARSGNKPTGFGLFGTPGALRSRLPQ